MSANSEQTESRLKHRSSVTPRLAGRFTDTEFYEPSGRTIQYLAEMTREKILQLWPNATESTIRRNLDADDTGLRSTAGKPVERMPLAANREAENPHWYAAARCFEIEFVVYSVRPADADGYSTKALCDFCVKTGILPDDRWDVVVKSSISSRKAATEGEEKTEVKITAIK